MKKKIPTEEELNELGVKSWGIWEKEKSVFDWSYSDTETCYILDGEIEVTDNSTGEKLEFKKGDLVQFPKGLECVWNVKKAVRKYYNFGDLKI
ncbi:MAG TPA: cupin domain-containing protein [Candidatus Nanopelagicaceae bacterium]|nr:cupin domain-containing protein [Candidatus Nanopelagicaceae bacterium]